MKTQSILILIGITAVCLIAWVWRDISRVFSTPYGYHGSDDDDQPDNDTATVMCMVAAVCCL